MHGVNWILTVCDLSGNEFKSFVEKYHWNGELHYGHPFFKGQWTHLEYGLKQTRKTLLINYQLFNRFIAIEIWCTGFLQIFVK